MTTAGPHSPRADHRMCSSADSNETPKNHGSRLPVVSMALGALSVTSFWVVGLGFILGVAAVVCGAIAASRSAVVDDEAASLRALRHKSLIKLTGDSTAYGRWYLSDYSTRIGPRRTCPATAAPSLGSVWLRTDGVDRCDIHDRAGAALFEKPPNFVLEAQDNGFQVHREHSI